MKDYKEIERFLDYIDRHINGDVLLKGGEESTYPYAHYERLLDNIYEYTKFIFENKQKNKQRLAEDDNYSNEQEIVMEDKGMFNDIRDYFNGPPSESLHVVAPAGPREDPGKNSSHNDSISSLFSYEPSSKPSSMEYEKESDDTDFWGNPVKEVKEEIRELTSNGNNEGSRTLWESMTYTPSEELVNKPNIEEVVPEPPKKRLLLKGEEMV